MSRKRNITDDAFRGSLRGFEQNPPAEVWNGINAVLEQDRRKVRMVWFGRIAAAAAIVISAGTIVLLVQRGPSTEISRQESVEMEKSTQGSEPETNAPEESISRETIPGESDTREFVEDEIGSDQLAESNRVTEQTPREDPAMLTESAERTESILIAESTGPAENNDEPLLADMPSERILAGNYLIPVQYPSPDLAVPSRDEFVILEDAEEGIDVFQEFGEDPAENYDRWAVGGQLSPLYSYRDLGTSPSGSMAYASTSQSSAPASSLDDAESGIVSYAGGLNLHYSPARRLSLQSGLYYSRMGMSVRNSYIASAGNQVYRIDFPQAALAISNSSGDIVLGGEKANAVLSNSAPSREAFSDAHEFSSNTMDAEIRQGDILQHFEYLEVPMILRYRLLDRRFGLNLLGGLSTNFLVGSKVYFQENGSKEFIGTTANIRSINYSSVVGMGLQYSINRNFHLNFEPTFRYYLNSVNTGTGFDSHPYSLGFFTGVSYSF